MKECTLFLPFLDYDEVVPIKLTILIKILENCKISIYFPTVVACYRKPSVYVYKLLPTKS